MIKFIIGFFILSSSVFANTSLFYEVNKAGKSLGYYEINLNDKQKNITTKSYGVANKIKFFVDKKIKYIDEGTRNISFTKNKIISKFIVQTKLNLIDEKTKKQYKRKLRKVKNNDMLLLRKNGKNSIELFNKRKIIFLTLEEVLKLVIDKNIKESNIILFEKSGVMKMIAKIVPTNDGFDIVNKSKGTKYIKVLVKNDIPISVSSYVSDWSMKIYGSGEFKINTINSKQIEKSAQEVVSKLYAKDSKIEIVNFDKVKGLKKSFRVFYRAKFVYPEGTKQSDRKRYCKKAYKKYAKKGKDIEYNDENCVVTISKTVSKKSVTKPFLEKLIVQHPQLKFTKKYKVSKKNTIMYKIIDKVN